ncbi:MAG TPA: amidohydrolase family protein [Acidobacteriaceae bacterium]|nr:amidohydrolase family protein [Acidobacteriaceae bacterium]
MKKIAFSLALMFLAAGCSRQPKPGPTTSPAAVAAPVSGPFSSQELQEFAALNPIDTHTHVFASDPAFYAMLKKLNLHILDITLVDKSDPETTNLTTETKNAWDVVHGNNGYAAYCSTFDPFKFGQPHFAQESIRKINADFAKGAVAVKIWKNVGMKLKDAKGNYVMPDNPAFQPIFKDIAAHNKTLIAHLADPDTIWAAPNPAAFDYGYYTKHPELYMYGKPGVPTKQEILQARDVILKRNPKLRVVGAHLGSMEADFHQLGQHLDQYPNFAVDLAARMDYVATQPHADIIAFITKYQDRLIYGTDNGFDRSRDEQKALSSWEDRYAKDWRFLATNDMVDYKGHKVQGLSLPQPILRKIFHDNAVKWFPGILGASH